MRMTSSRLILAFKVPISLYVYQLFLVSGNLADTASHPISTAVEDARDMMLRCREPATHIVALICWFTGSFFTYILLRSRPLWRVFTFYNRSRFMHSSMWRFVRTRGLVCIHWWIHCDSLCWYRSKKSIIEGLWCQNPRPEKILLQARTEDGWCPTNGFQGKVCDRIPLCEQ